MVQHADSQHKVSSIPPCVTSKTPMVRKATGNHLTSSTSVEETQSLSLVSATLEIEYAMYAHLIDICFVSLKNGDESTRGPSCHYFLRCIKAQRSVIARNEVKLAGKRSYHVIRGTVCIPI